jgi:hypothetical protein
MQGEKHPSLGRRGATAIEYAVLLGLAILAVATAIMIAGQWTARSPGNGPPPELTRQALEADPTDR